MKKPLSLFCSTFSIILLVGVSCTHTNISSTQLGNFVSAAPIDAYPRGWASSFIIGDTAYVGLGYNQTIGMTGRITDFWKFTANNGWTQMAAFTGAPRSNAASFSIGNYGFVGVGWDGNQNFTDFYRYNADKDIWEKMDDYPGGPRYDAVGFAVQGKGYIGCGFNIYWLNDFYSYDTTSGKWSKTSGTSGDFSKRQGAVAFVYKDKAYVVTGWNGGGYCKDMWSFDPSQQAAWTRLSDITNTNSATYDDGYTDLQRRDATVFVNGGFAFLMTGFNTSLVTSTWGYDINADRWTRRTPYPLASRRGAVSFTVSGRSFIGSGTDGNNTFDDFDEFQPAQLYNSNSF